MKRVTNDRSLFETLRQAPVLQSPKVHFSLVNELQEKVRERELKLISLEKLNEKLKIENKELTAVLNEKDKHIQKLNEEVFDLKKSANRADVYSQKDLLSSQNLQKIKKSYLEESFKLEDELKTFKAIFAEEKKNVENKLKVHSEREKEFLSKISELENEVKNLTSELYEMAPNDSTHLIEEENQDLRRQLEVFKKSTNLSELVKLSPDIHQIAYQVHQLLIILQNLRQGKDVSLRVLLTTDESNPVNYSKQLLIDVAELRKDVDAIKQKT